MLTIVILLISVMIALQFKPVQTYVAKRAAKYLSKELQTTVDIKSLYLVPFKSLVLEGLYIQDKQRDTLLYSGKFTVDINSLSFANRKISVRKIQLDKSRFFLKYYKNGKTNLAFIINYFDSGEPDEKKPSGKPFDVKLQKIVLNDLAFKYRDYAINDTIKGINFDDIDLYNLNTTLLNLDTREHLFKATVQKLRFQEKSGFVLNELSGDAVVDSNKIEIHKFKLVTPSSRLSDYLLMKFKTFDDFNDFITKVYVKANLKNSRVSSRDISFFTDALDDMNFSVGMDGKISGLVNNIKARNMSIKAGQATYLKGNIDIRNLPDVERTVLDIRLQQLATNKKDADLVLQQFGLGRNFLPEILDKFGNIHYQGHLHGGFYRFSSQGEVKTSLGRVVEDLSFVLDGKGSFKGTVQPYDFDIGSLIDQQTLGRSTFHAEVNASGLDARNFHMDVDLNGDYLEFNKYKYHNLDVDGKVTTESFAGLISVNDRNVKLHTDGTLQFGGKKQKYDIIGNVGYANLRELGLTSDTVQTSASLTASIEGSEINDLSGSINISNIRVTNPDTSVLVRNIAVNASGSGVLRKIEIESEILSASLTGKYQLSSLPHYMMALARKYIPSLPVKPKAFAEQNFEASVTLRNFAPISMLIAPKIKIPEGAYFYASFKPEGQSSAMTMSSPLIQYGDIRVRNYILDGLTNERQMVLFATADRVLFNDSLFINNVNIANILRNDSLNLNVKVSDKTESDQLDLNGLVQFGTDTLARLSILPSDVIIQGQSWKIPDQVRIYLDEGKVSIRKFELQREDQLLTIDGVISPNPDDKLNLDFSKFQISTFNQLMRTFGVNLRGVLNGEISIAGATKNPRIEAALKTDSVAMNNIELGTLSVNAGMDNATKMINVDIEMMHDDRRTLSAKGTYDIMATRNSVNLALEMDESELVVLEPFTTGLVSNLKGKATTNLTIEGTLAAPRFNGEVKLIDAGFTVDYLKTAYKVNDDFKIDNSLIRLENLELRDVKNNVAKASGTVDLHNLSNPDIEVAVRANNFQVLNTTAKDNSLYYGTAYASGLFRFSGPTDNINIDIRASSNEGTIFNIPLNSSETIGNNDFISFVSKDSMNMERPRSLIRPGMTMNFDLNLNESAQVNIFTTIGRLSATGTSNLIMKITPDGDFEMYGDYLIKDGKFQFTAQDFINKIFDLRQGGSIRWTSGDPTAAIINMKAVYSLRTDIKPLYVAAGRAANEGRVLTEAIMNLTGNLSQPEISFDIDFPSDANIKDELQGYLSDVNNKNSQALSLIVRRSFSPNTGNVNVQDVNNTLISAGTELFVNQFNNILSQMLNLNFVDLNIRSFNEASASFRFLKDRLVLTAGVTDRRTGVNDQNLIGNTVSRDAEMMYLIKKDGSLTARVSNKLNNRNFLNPDQEYISAVGLVYRQDFETFGEFLRNLVSKERKEERNSGQRRLNTPPSNMAPERRDSVKTKLPEKAKTGK